MKSYVGLLILLAVVGFSVYFVFASVISVPRDQIMIVKYDEFYYRVLEPDQSYFIPFWEEKYVYPNNRVILDSVEAMTKDGVVVPVIFSFAYDVENPQALFMHKVYPYTDVYDFPKFKTQEDMENYLLVFVQWAIRVQMSKMTYGEFMRGGHSFDVKDIEGVNIHHTVISR